MGDEGVADRVRHGKAWRSLRAVHQGMQIQDTIEGVTYVADAEGNAAAPVKLAPRL